MSVAVAKPDKAAVNAEINTLLRRADQGDERAVATLREMSDTAMPELWREFGDLSRMARVQMVDKIAGQNRIVGEAVAREVGRLRRTWAGEDPTPLEMALAERIAACWLHLSYVECSYTAPAPGRSWEEDEQHRKRIDQAERRYIRAIKALAEVRRIQLPTVQLNVGEKQVIIGR